MGTPTSLPPRKVFTGTFKATPRMEELIQEVLDSGRISYGEKSRKFEQEFAKIHSAKYGTLSNSGTSSLHVALQTLKEIHGWNRGDEVIVPATTFIATSNIIKHNDLTPIFVDVDPLYYNIDPELIEAKISDRTRAIIPVHLFGQAANMTRVMEIAKKHNLKVIEDSCEAMFVSHDHQMVGSMGDIGCFSTYNAHLMTTGVGGVAITNNPDYAAKMRSLVNHGLRLEDLNLDKDMQPQPMLNRRFHFDTLGHSYRITEFEAALGLAQLETYHDMLNKRLAHARHYSSGIKLVNKKVSEPILQSPVRMPENEHAYMMYPIVLYKDKNGENIDKSIFTNFLNKHGVETRDMLPILGQPIYQYIASKDFPVSQWLVDSGFYVGCHQDLTVDDVQYVIDLLHSVVYDNFSIG